MQTTETHPIIAGFVVEYQADWMPESMLATIIRVIPPSRSRLGRIFGGARPVYVISTALGDTTPFACNAECIRGI